MRASCGSVLSRLTGTDWAFLHFKLALCLVWVLSMRANQVFTDTLGPLLTYAWVAMSFVGLIVSATGLIMSAQDYWTRRRGVHVEMVGLWIMLAAPLVYLCVNLGLWASTGEPRWVPSAYSYVLCAALAARMIMVRSVALRRTVTVLVGED